MKKILLVVFFSSSLFTFAQNVNLTNLSSFEGEPYIAINPTNSQNIVVAWMGYVFGTGTRITIKVKNSFNGGQTWSSTYNIPHQSPNFTSADVSMAFDVSGKLFLAYIDYKQSPDSGAVFLLKSLNGGVTWSAPTTVITAFADGTKTPLDRPWLLVDNAGTNIYVTTKPAPWIPAPNRPYFIGSNNGGITFNQNRYLDTLNYLVGNVIAAPMAAPAIIGNTVIAAYPSYLVSQSIFPRYILAKSINKGGTFTYSTIINQTSNLAFNDSAKAVYKLLTNPANTSHYVFLYIGSLTGADLDVLITETFNAGATWSAPARVNDDIANNGKMQDLVWADFATNGDLAITWRDRRNASGTGYARASEIYATYRANGTGTFTPNFKISTLLENYNNVLVQSGNDMMCTTLKNDTIHSVWGSTRDGSLDIWYSKIYAKTGTTTSIKLIDSESFGINTFPNPTTNTLYVTTSNNQPINKVEIYTLDGKLIYTEKKETLHALIDVSNFSNGIYLLKIYQQNQVFRKKIIKQ